MTKTIQIACGAVLLLSCAGLYNFSWGSEREQGSEQLNRRPSSVTAAARTSSLATSVLQPALYVPWGKATPHQSHPTLERSFSLQRSTAAAFFNPRPADVLADHPVRSPAPLAKKEESLDPLLQAIQQTERAVQSKLSSLRPDSPRVLVLGTTGSGKSTLVQGLAGKPLGASSPKKGRRTLGVLEADSLPGFVIGHGLGSETQLPNLFYDQPLGLLYCDCPGFMDSRGINQEVVNAFAINQLFEAQSPIKIVLALQESEFDGARGMEAVGQLNRLMTLVPDLAQLLKALVLVVTKGTYAPIEKVQGLLSDVAEEKDKRQRLGSDFSDLVAPLAFLEVLAQNPSKVFSLPLAAVDGPYKFPDRSGILASLKRDGVTGIRHILCLDESVLYGVLRQMDKMGNIQSLVRGFVETAQTDYRVKPETLKEWSVFVEALMRSRDSAQMISHLEQSLPAHIKKQFALLIDELKRAQRYVDFAKQVAKGSSKDFPIPQTFDVLVPYLVNMQMELGQLIAKQALIQKQQAETDLLKKKMEAASSQNQESQQEIRRQIQEVQYRAQQEKEQLSSQLSSLMQRQKQEERYLQRKLDSQKEKFEVDLRGLRQQLPNLESEVRSLQQKLASAIERAERAEARQQGGMGMMGGGQLVMGPHGPMIIQGHPFGFGGGFF